MATKNCSVDGCENIHFGKGLCKKHYSRLRRNGSTELPEKKKCQVEGCDKKHFGRGFCRSHYRQDEKCSVEGCEKKVIAKGLCGKHYTRNKVHGCPTTYLVKSDVREWLDWAAEQVTDECLIFPFKATVRGYGVFHGGEDTKYAHRYVLQKVSDKPEGLFYACHKPVICHNRLCCNPSHLYWGTPSDNINDCFIDGTMERAGKCSVDGCDKKWHSKKTRLCSTHYGRWLRTGSTNLKSESIRCQP